MLGIIETDSRSEILNYIRENKLENNVIILDKFITEDLAMDYLRACNIHIYAYGYHNTGSSGSIRFSMASFRPIVVTKIPIFENYKNLMIFIDDNSPLNIIKGIEKAMDENITKTLVKNMKKYVNETNWDKFCQKMYKIYQSIK